MDLGQRVMWQLNKRIISFAMALFCALIVGVSSSFAGDRATLNVLGYSENGRYFAFEQFGVQDGSGFAYAQIFVVDVIEDRWVVGTPIDVQADTENTSLSEIRRTALDQATPRLESLDIHRPADILAYIGSGAFNTDGLSLDFGVPNLFDFGRPPDERFSLTLDTYKTSSAAPCNDWFGEIGLGFSLYLTAEGVARQIHEDDILPRSRGCPISYSITGIYAPFQAQELDHAIAIISVFPRGFEGPDRRYIAVPIGTK